MNLNCDNCADVTWSLRMVSVKVPGAALSGHSVQLECQFSLDDDSLYAVKWYRGVDEFYRYVPAEEPPATIFALDGIDVDVSPLLSSTVIQFPPKKSECRLVYFSDLFFLMYLLIVYF